MQDWGQLEAFRAVAEESSFTAAAHRLHLSQSAVSRRVAALEKRLRITLLLRDWPSVRLTANGDVVLRGVVRLEALRQDILDQISEPTDVDIELPAVVRVATPIVAFSALSAGLARRFPGSSFTYHALSVSACLSAVSTGHADIAVAYVFPTLHVPTQLHVATRLLMLAPLWVATRPDHPAVGAPSAHLADFDHDNWIVDSDTATATAELSTLAVGLPHPPRAAHHTTNPTAMTDLITTGQGVTLISPLVAPPPTVSIVPVTDPPAHQLILSWNQNTLTPTTARAIAETLTDALLTALLHTAPTLRGWLVDHASPLSSRWLTTHTT